MYSKLFKDSRDLKMVNVIKLYMFLFKIEGEDGAKGIEGWLQEYWFYIIYYFLILTLFEYQKFLKSITLYFNKDRWRIHKIFVIFLTFGFAFSQFFSILLMSLTKTPKSNYSYPIFQNSGILAVKTTPSSPTIIDPSF